jgi:hypothetical protein
MEISKKTERKICTIVAVVVGLYIFLVGCIFGYLIFSVISDLIYPPQEEVFLSQDSTWVDESGNFIMTVSKEDETIFISAKDNSLELSSCDFNYHSPKDELLLFEFIKGESNLSEGGLIKYDYVTYWEWDGEDVFTVKISYADTYHYGYGRKKVHPSLSFEKGETFEIVFRRQENSQ